MKPSGEQLSPPMTEAEWTSGKNAHRLLSHVRDKAAMSPQGRRKLRLFACGAVRGVWPLVHDDRFRHAVEVGEQFADDLLGLEERQATWNTVDKRLLELQGTGNSPLCAAATVVMDDVRWDPAFIFHLSVAGLDQSSSAEEWRSRPQE